MSDRDMMDVIRSRHSVRQYTGKRIPDELREQLDAFAGELNRESSIRIRIFYDEPACYGTRMARYGRFENCRDYISLVGKKAPDLEERCGYYGERLVLKAQELGLNTCWAALTHGKSRADVGRGETECIVIALGYGKTQGSARKSKAPSEVSDMTERVDMIDCDLADVEDYIDELEESFDDNWDDDWYDEDDEDDGEGYEFECPNCHETVYFDDSIFDDEDFELECPACGAKLDSLFDFEDDDEGDEE